VGGKSQLFRNKVCGSGTGSWVKKKEVFEAQCQRMRAKNSGETPEKKPPGRAVTSTTETYLLVEEVAAKYRLSRDTVTRRFENEFDTLITPRKPPSRYKRRYRILRIPESAIRRVLFPNDEENN
jgi:hypothetical protein